MAHATIEDIPTERFNALLAEHLAQGWTVDFEYDGFDAWIDYGRVDLRRGAVTLCFEWTNWFEGEISGPEELIAQLATAHGLRRR